MSFQSKPVRLEVEECWEPNNIYPIDFHCINKTTETILSIPQTKKGQIQVLNDMRVNKWRKNFYFGKNYPFKSLPIKAPIKYIHTHLDWLLLLFCSWVVFWECCQHCIFRMICQVKNSFETWVSRPLHFVFHWAFLKWKSVALPIYHQERTDI